MREEKKIFVSELKQKGLTIHLIKEGAVKMAHINLWSEEDCGDITVHC
jgi:hypothetical protein